MKFKSQIITSASGSIGGTTFSRNKGGMYMRARAIPTNPNTQSQVDARARFGLYSSNWGNLLTDTQRTDWNTYGETVEVTDALGDKIRISGIAHYIRSNTLLEQAGGVAVVVPPTSQQPAIDISAIVVTSEDGDAEIVATIGATGWEAEDGAFLLVQQSRGFPVGVNSSRGKAMRFAGSVPGDAITPPTTLGINNSFILAEGQTNFLRMRAVAVDGAVGQEQVFSTIVAA